MRALQSYATLTGPGACRRAFLLSHFGESLRDPVCDTATSSRGCCCDLCGENYAQSDTAVGASASTYDGAGCAIDVGSEVRLLCESVIACGEWFGITIPVNVLCGSADKTIQAKVHYTAYCTVLGLYPCITIHLTNPPPHPLTIIPLIKQKTQTHIHTQVPHFASLAVFGQGQGHTRAWWRALGYVL